MTCNSPHVTTKKNQRRLTHLTLMAHSGHTLYSGYRHDSVPVSSSIVAAGSRLFKVTPHHNVYMVPVRCKTQHMRNVFKKNPASCAMTCFYNLYNQSYCVLRMLHSGGLQYPPAQTVFDAILKLQNNCIRIRVILWTCDALLMCRVFVLVLWVNHCKPAFSQSVLRRSHFSYWC